MDSGYPVKKKKDDFPDHIWGKKEKKRQSSRVFAGVCSLPSSHMVKGLINHWSSWFYMRKKWSFLSFFPLYRTKILHKPLIHLYCHCNIKPTVVPDLRLEVDWSHGEKINRNMGTCSTSWLPVKTQEVVGVSEGVEIDGGWRRGRLQSCKLHFDTPMKLLWEEMKRSRLPQLLQNLLTLISFRCFTINIYGVELNVNFVI